MTAAGQVPPPHKINIDHVAHFVPHIDAASAALEQAGFTLTPFSAQSHRLEPGGPLVPAGSGNRCIMLREGYLEFLTPTADTPIANQLRTAIQRYTGLHLIAFGSAGAEVDHARLEKNGFTPLPTVALQRQIVSSTASSTRRSGCGRIAGPHTPTAHAASLQSSSVQPIRRKPRSVMRALPDCWPRSATSNGALTPSAGHCCS
jgi:hypothetical protein